MNTETYDALAEILYFPGPSYPEQVRHCRNVLQSNYPGIAEKFDPFAEFVAQIPYRELEKLYMRTFDIQPLCCMDVGYVLYGEDYTRGKLMANLNKELHQAGLDNRGELADRLPNVLRLMPRLQDTELLNELVGYIMKPALDKMVDDFLPARIREKEEVYEKFHKTVLNKREDYVTQYRIPLLTVRELLDADFPEVPTKDMGADRDFIDSVKNEMKNSAKTENF